MIGDEVVVEARRESLATTAEVAEYLRISDTTLAQWRRDGRGPAWVKLGGLVRYDWNVVREWIAGGGERDD